MVPITKDEIFSDCARVLAVDLNSTDAWTEFERDVSIGIFAEYVFTVTHIKQKRVLTVTAEKQVVPFLASDNVVGVPAACDVAVVVVTRQNMVLEFRQGAIGNTGAIGEANSINRTGIGARHHAPASNKAERGRVAVLN